MKVQESGSSVSSPSETHTLPNESFITGDDR